MARRTYRAELAGDAAWVWLLRIDWAGGSHRYASRPVSVVDGDGVSYLYLGGLDLPDVSIAAGQIGGSPDYLAVPIEVQWAGARSIAQMIEDGHDLTDATAELALWVEGTPLESRWVIVRGALWQPTYGDVDEPMSTTIRQAPMLGSRTLPDPTAVVNPETWPDCATYADRASTGRHYPVVFGEPGVWNVDTALAVNVPATPALVVQVDNDGERAETLLISDRPVSASTVQIVADGDLIGTTYNVSTAQDGLGRYVATVDLTSTADDLRRAQEYRVIWSSGAAAVGEGGAPTLLGDVVLWLLRQSGADVDWGRWYTMAASLNVIEVGGYINAPTEVVPYIVDQLLSLAPVDIIAGGEGVYPVLWTDGAQVADAVQALEEGRNASRVSMVQYERSPEDRASVVRVTYAHDDDQGTPRATQALVSAEEWGGDTPDEVPDPALRPGGTERTIEGVTLWNRDAALWVGQQAALWWGSIPRSVVYECPADVAAWLELGDVVTITDAGLAWSSRPARVAGLSLSPGGSVEVTLSVRRRAR